MSSNVMLTFKNILANGESDYTLDDLKDELGLVNDKSLMDFLLRLLKEEIEDTTSYTMFYEKPIIEIIYSYITTYITENRQYDIENIVLRLNMIRVNIDNNLRRLRDKYQGKDDGLLLSEKQFWTSLCSLNKKLFELIHIGNNHEIISDDYFLLHDIIYNIKNLNLLKEITSRLPRLLSVCDGEGKSFFSNLIKHYIEILKEEQTKITDITYYDAIINLFLENDYLKIDKKLKDLISVSADQIKRSNKLSKEDNIQRQIFLLHLRKKIMGESDYVFSKRELNDKYKYNIITPRNDKSDIASCFACKKGLYFDLKDKDVITIDPSGSLDLDDGISLEKLKNNNYLLGVYITDVSNFIPFNSRDDIKALRNGETIYAADRVIFPMLSEDLTLNCCSLLPGNTRKTIVCFFEIEPDGNIKRHFFTKGLIKTRDTHHLSYNEASNILNNGGSNPKIYDILTNLQRLSSMGTFKTMHIDEKVREEKVEVHSIIEKFMVLTNYMAALDAKKAGVPFIYRAHHMIDASVILNANPSLSSLINKFDDPIIRDMMKSIIGGSFSRAYYTVDAVGHEGLKLDAYAHTTSPLRRYADLVNQRLIKLFFIDSFRKEKTLYQIDAILREIIDKLNSNEVITNQYVNDYAHVLRK